MLLRAGDGVTGVDVGNGKSGIVPTEETVDGLDVEVCGDVTFGEYTSSSAVLVSDSRNWVVSCGLFCCGLY